MSLEEDLKNMFKFMGLSKGKNVNELLDTLVRNAQINTLKAVRQQLDSFIKKLQGESTVSYDPSLDPYKILGVEMTATREEIDKAFKKKAWETHPDRGGSNEEMIRVNAAYQAIKQFRGWK